MTKDQIILGVDPGSTVMGYAIIHVRGKNISVLEMDVVKLSMHKDIYARLEVIHTRICSIIDKHKPTTFAIEAPFFGKNVQSMLKLGRAQGVAIAAAMQFAIDVTEYSPRKVKQSITGNGNADKEQVWNMLQRLLSLTEKPKYFDATDALAIALCHHYQTSNPLTKLKSAKGWEDFIKKNPDRVG